MVVFFRNFQKGNLVNWDHAEFELSNMDVLEDSGMQQMCHPTQPGNTLMPNRMTFEDAKLTCRRFRGEMTVVTDQDVQDELVAKAHKRGTCIKTNTGYLCCTQ